MLKLSGKTAIVTGGARGYGAAIARVFKAEGARVIVTDILEDEGADFAKSTGVEFRCQDVSNEHSWIDLAIEFTESASGVDVLVNNAGVLHQASLIGHTTKDWNRLIAINQTSVFFAMRTFGELMVGQGFGSIINVSSVAAQQCTANSLAYTASKAAVVSMTKVAAKEFGPAGVRVNTILPGMMDTQMVDELDPDWRARNKLIRSVPLGRTADPEELAPMALFLASDDSSYCTGESFRVDGGSAC